jgi:amino acid transporter
MKKALTKKGFLYLIISTNVVGFIISIVTCFITWDKREWGYGFLCYEIGCAITGILSLLFMLASLVKFKWQITKDIWIILLYLFFLIVNYWELFLIHNIQPLK